MASKQKVQYTVESIDVDGDNIPDGDLVTKYVNGKVVSRKFVPLAKLKQVVKEAEAEAKVAEAKTASSSSRTPSGTRMVYKNMPSVDKTDKPVVVAEQTGFGQYLKAGAGTEAGRLITDAIFTGIASLFN